MQDRLSMDRAVDAGQAERRSAWVRRARAEQLRYEQEQFERNSHVTPDGTVVTGYGGLASFTDSDGTVYENPDCCTPSPARLERDSRRSHALRARVMSERAIEAGRPRGGSLAPTRRLPQARRPRPAGRRRTVSTRAGPDDDSGEPEPGEPAGHPDDLDAWLADRRRVLAALIGGGA